MPTTPAPNIVRPFLFEHLDIRGAFVQLHGAWGEMLAGRGYPWPLARLLGEMTSVTVLIAANLKQPGRMTFQLKGGGPVKLLLIDCDTQLQLRGMAQAEPELADASAPDLLGHGQLALTLDVPGLRQPYQSLVPLAGDSIAAIFEHYLEHSEQQPTRLFLAASEQAAAGLFLQKMPGSAQPGGDERDPDAWNRIQILAGTVRAEELLDLPSITLLTRLFPEEDVRIFDPRQVAYSCPEDWAKIHAMLRSIGRQECESILQEKGELLIHDDVCNRDYRLDADRLAAVFAGADPDSA